MFVNWRNVTFSESLERKSLIWMAHSPPGTDQDLFNWPKLEPEAMKTEIVVLAA